MIKKESREFPEDAVKKRKTFPLFEPSSSQKKQRIQNSPLHLFRPIVALNNQIMHYIFPKLFSTPQNIFTSSSFSLQDNKYFQDLKTKVLRKRPLLDLFRPETTNLFNDEAEKFIKTLPNLACETYGSHIIYSTNNFFTNASNILKKSQPEKPKNPDEITLIDGWQTEFRKTSLHDWCIIELSMPCQIFGCEIDVSYIKSTRAPAISIEAASIPTLNKQICDALKSVNLPLYSHSSPKQSSESIEAVTSLLQLQGQEDPQQWRDLLEIISLVDLKSDKIFIPINQFPLTNITHIRLNLFPDGGISRLRMFGIPTTPRLPTKTLCVSDLRLGALVISSSESEVGNPLTVLHHESLRSESSIWQPVRSLKRLPLIESNNLVISESFILIKLAARAIINKIDISAKNCEGKLPDCIKILGYDNKQSINDLLLEKKFFDQFKYKSDMEIMNKSWKLVVERISFQDDLIVSITSQALTEPRTRRHSTRRNTPTASFVDTTKHSFLDAESGPFTHLCFFIIPDGAIHSIQVWGDEV